MYEISIHDEIDLFREFGINARLIIDHSKGIEPTTISEIKHYKPKSKSLSTSQILFTDYKAEDAKKVLIEMLDVMYLELVKTEKLTTCISFFVGYSKDIIRPLSISKRIDPTDSFQVLLKILIKEYDLNVSRNYLIRRLGISLSGFVDGGIQLNLFDNNPDNEDDLGNTINNIKNKYGKNYIMRGVSISDKATALKRNKLIGGHNAE